MAIRGPDVEESAMRRVAVTSAKTKDHSLRAIDFASHRLPAGAQGPPGAPGQQGAPGPGVSTVTVRAATSSMATNSSTVHCMPGEKVLGGGYNGMNTGHAFASHPDPVDESPMGWHAESTSGSDVVTVYVLCGSG
jgi:hypothetical protein